MAQKLPDTTAMKKKSLKISIKEKKSSEVLIYFRKVNLSI